MWTDVKCCEPTGHWEQPLASAGHVIALTTDLSAWSALARPLRAATCNSSNSKNTRREDRSSRLVRAGTIWGGLVSMRLSGCLEQNGTDFHPKSCGVRSVCCDVGGARLLTPRRAPIRRRGLAPVRGSAQHLLKWLNHLVSGRRARLRRGDETRCVGQEESLEAVRVRRPRTKTNTPKD
jgi:hypothetical protein